MVESGSNPRIRNEVNFQKILFDCFKNNLFGVSDARNLSAQKNSSSAWIVLKCDYGIIPSFEIVEPQPINICDPALGPALYIQYTNFHSVRYGEISEVRIFGRDASHDSEPFYTIGCYDGEFTETILNMEQDDGKNFARYLFNFLKAT